MVIRLISVLILGVMLVNDVIGEEHTVFPDARIMYSQTLDDHRYIVALDGLKKINGVWEVEKTQLVTGRVERQTREVLSTRSFNFAQNELLKYLDKVNASPIFTCENFACGSSNAWANERFKIKQLYGLDARQYYGVWNIEREEAKGLLVAYLVQRGNQRIYLQTDWIKVDSTPSLLPSARFVLEQLDERGYYVLGQSDAEPARAKLVELLKQVLVIRPSERFYLVGHDHSQGALDEQIARSLERAKIISLAVGQEGRLLPHGLGSLAPAAREKDLNTFVVLVKP